MYSDIHWCSLDGGSVQLEHSIIAAQKTTVEYNSSLSSSLQQSTAAFNASSPSSGLTSIAAFLVGLCTKKASSVFSFLS